MNTNVVACAVLSAFGLSAGDSGPYSATTSETHLGMVVAVLVPSTGPIRRLTQRSGGDASDTDGQAAGRVSGSERVKRLYNDSMRVYESKNFTLHHEWTMRLRQGYGATGE